MTKYRIVEETNKNGDTRYTIQTKFLFFWFTFYRGFASIDSAEAVMAYQIYREAAKKILKTRIIDD